MSSQKVKFKIQAQDKRYPFWETIKESDDEMTPEMMDFWRRIVSCQRKEPDPDLAGYRIIEVTERVTMRFTPKENSNGI